METIYCLQNQTIDDVEVVVSDNGSGKSLSDFEGRIRAVIPRVKIHSNDINLGFDKNVDLCGKKHRNLCVVFGLWGHDFTMQLMRSWLV